MENTHGLYVFAPGDKIYVRSSASTGTDVYRAVLMKKDSDVCFGCSFSVKCRTYKGNSPFSRSCYTTVFEKEHDMNAKPRTRR